MMSSTVSSIPKICIKLLHLSSLLRWIIWDIFGKLSVAGLVKKFPRLQCNWSLTTVFSKAHHQEALSSGSIVESSPRLHTAFI
jgi:hypothetical protein